MDQTTLAFMAMLVGGIRKLLPTCHCIENDSSYSSSNNILDVQGNNSLMPRVTDEKVV